jgi:hypothetical protein
VKNFLGATISRGIFKQNSCTISLTDFASGTYILSIEGNYWKLIR